MTILPLWLLKFLSPLSQLHRMKRFIFYDQIYKISKSGQRCEMSEMEANGRRIE